MPTADPVTVAITNYNGGEVLLETVEAFSRLAYPLAEILIVDNASSDGSLEAVTARHPGVRVVRLPLNRGPSAARNEALRQSRTDLVFLSDNDITARPDMLTLLVGEMRKDSRTAICSPRVLYSDGLTVLSDGVRLHYLAVSMPRNRRRLAAGITDAAPRVHACASGGMMLVDRARIGPDALFDEDYFFGWDDVEFSYRQSLRGFSAVTVPAAAAVHKEKSWGTKRSFFQVRNRWYLLLSCYSLKTLVLIAPMLIFYEAGLASLMILKGESATYWRAMKEVVGRLGSIRAKRRTLQATRAVKDAALLESGDIYIEEGLVTKGWLMRMIRMGNRLMDLYWCVVRRLL